MQVFRNDALTVEEAEALAPTQLVISPGPGRPSDAGISVELIRRLGPQVPTLGVCLGHQAIVEAFGGEVGAAKALLHGKASEVEHDGKGVFAGLPQGLAAGRYHSLAATTIPDELEVSARTPDGEVMGVRHRALRIEGVQFHPESVLTPQGPHLLATFLRQAGEGEASRLDAASGSFATAGIAEPDDAPSTQATAGALP